MNVRALDENDDPGSDLKLYSPSRGSAFDPASITQLPVCTSSTGVVRSRHMRDRDGRCIFCSRLRPRTWYGRRATKRTR